jgi:hypothetical protein
MKLFVISFLISVGSLFLVSLQAVGTSQYIEVLARVIFYFSFPLAMVLSILFMMIGHLFEKKKKGEPFTHQIPADSNSYSLAKQKVV